MKISLNELQVTCRNACKALGFPFGMDEEAAFMVSWLEIHGLNGLQRFLAVLPELRSRPPWSGCVAPGGDDASVNCNGASALAVAPSLVDLFEPRHAVAAGPMLTVRDCREPGFFLPAIVRVAAPGSDWELHQDAADGRVIIRVRAGRDLFVAEGAGAAGDEPLRIARHLTDDALPAGSHLPYDSLGQRERSILQHGLAVDPAHWEPVVTLAHQALVPPTRRSRERGAGGGDAND